MKTLFDKTQLGQMALKNRFFRAAIGEKTSDGQVNEHILGLYKELALGGTGTLITGFTLVVMRLPMLGEQIDIEQTKTMVNQFLAAGFTYFDTAYGDNDGKSEETAKIALIGRYPREKFQFATKLPAWAGAKDADFYLCRSSSAGFPPIHLPV